MVVRIGDRDIEGAQKRAKAFIAENG